MSPEAQKLAQALLDHHRKVCGLHSQVGSSVDSCLIAYGDLCERAGLPHLKPTVGRYLREVAQWCHDSGRPPLNALAVNHDTQRPGRGYDDAPGCSLKSWRDELAAAINFSGYPHFIS
jgi:hypothetical protein